MTAKVAKGTVFEDGGATFLARVRGNSGAAITQASLSTITCKVFDLDVAPDTSILAPSVVIASTVFDTMQGASFSDARWTADATGYNFLHEMPATAFPDGQRRYRVEYKFTPVSGAVFWLVFEVLALEIRS